MRGPEKSNMSARELAKDTHKFESRYLDRLIGPYPEHCDLYLERSPIHFTDRLNCPMIIFQGLEGKVVPPNQAEKMVEAVACLADSVDPRGPKAP